MGCGSSRNVGSSRDRTNEQPPLANGMNQSNSSNDPHQQQKSPQGNANDKYVQLPSPIHGSVDANGKVHGASSDRSSGTVTSNGNHVKPNDNTLTQNKLTIQELMKGAHINITTHINHSNLTPDDTTNLSLISQIYSQFNSIPTNVRTVKLAEFAIYLFSFGSAIVSGTFSSCDPSINKRIQQQLQQALEHVTTIAARTTEANHTLQEQDGKSLDASHEALESLLQAAHHVNQAAAKVAATEADKIKVSSSPLPPVKPVLKAPEICNTAAHFALQRADLRAYGVDTVIADQLGAGWFLPPDEKEPLRISAAPKPFNPFARLVTGALPAPYGNLLVQNGLGHLDAQFFVARNRPELDEQWQSNDPQWVGKASMAKNHQFLLLRSLQWQTFNITTFGMEHEAMPKLTEPIGAPISTPTAAEQLSLRVTSLRTAITLLDDMESAAHAYAKAAGWSDRLGLFFHSYLLNSVHALHLHMLDMSVLGPTYDYFDYKNLPLTACREVLRQELKELEARAASSIQR